MARKTHHVVPSSCGGWDIKKGGSSESLTISTARQMLSSGQERLAGIRVRNL